MKNAHNNVKFVQRIVRKTSDLESQEQKLNQRENVCHVLISKTISEIVRKVVHIQMEECHYLLWSSFSLSRCDFTFFFVRLWALDIFGHLMVIAFANTVVNLDVVLTKN